MRSSSRPAPCWEKVAERAVGRHTHGLRRVDGQAQPRAVWAVAGRVEGPASTDGADIARGRDIGFRFWVVLYHPEMEAAVKRLYPV